MKNRFIYSFTSIDTKLSKNVKELREKNKYTLKKAEFIIHSLQEKLENKILIGIICVDSENKTQMIFENIEVYPSVEGEKVSLLEEIENQILRADEGIVSEPEKLRMSIIQEYENESFFDNNQIEKRNLRVPNIFPFGRKKALEKNIEADEMLIEYENELLEYDESELLDPPEKDIVELKEETEETEETEEAFELLEESLENEENTTSSQFNQELITDNLYPNNDNNVSVNAPVVLKKHESVKLPLPVEYCDLGEEINHSFTQMIEKLKTENLIRFIGIPLAGSMNTRIDAYRIDYAKTELSKANFENLREHHSRQVNGWIAEAMDQLRTGIDIAWKNPYDLDVKSKNSEKILEMEQIKEDKIQLFVKKQEDVTAEKVRRYEEEQEAELQHFISKQKAEKSTFVFDEMEKTQNLIDSKIDVFNLELEKEIDIFVDEEIYKAKIEANRFLFNGKQEVKKELALRLAEANEDTWEHTLKFIDKIQQEIESKTPMWTEKIIKSNELEEQEHRRNKEKKELELREEQLAISRLEAELDYRRIEDLDHENKRLVIKLETELSKNEIYELEKNNRIETPVSKSSFLGLSRI